MKYRAERRGSAAEMWLYRHQKHSRSHLVNQYAAPRGGIVEAVAGGGGGELEAALYSENSVP